MNEPARHNSTAWGLFIASALFALLASLTGSVIVMLASNVLFAFSIVFVTIYFAKQRRLAYFSVLIGIIGIGLFFAGHPFYGGALVAWGIVAAIVDCFQYRRWVPLIALGIIGATGAAIGGFLVYSVARATQQINASRATSPPVVQASVTPETQTTITAATESEPPITESETPLPSPIEERVTPAMPAQAMTFAPKESPQETARKRAEWQKKWREDAAQPHVYLEPRWKMYHVAGCPAVGPAMRWAPLSQASGFAPHICVPEEIRRQAR